MVFWQVELLLVIYTKKQRNYSAVGLEFDSFIDHTAKNIFIEVISDMYHHTNPDLNTHAPIISEETYQVVMANADVRSFSSY